MITYEIANIIKLGAILVGVKFYLLFFSLAAFAPALDISARA